MDQLWWMVDAVCDPAACEYHLINKRAALVAHGDNPPKLGVERDIDEQSGELLDGDPLQNHLTPEFALDEYFLFGVPTGWRKMPAFDSPGGGLESLQRELGEEER